MAAADTYHSAGSTICDQQKGHAAMRRAIDTQQHANEIARRATSAHATGARYNSVTGANRIARLEADALRITRQIDGAHPHRLHHWGGEKVTETTPSATGQHAEKLWNQREELDAQLAY